MSIRKKWAIPLLAVVLAAIAVFTFWDSGTRTVEAHQSPAGCSGTGLGVQVFADKTFAVEGQTITYSVSVNNELVGAIPCDVTNAFVNVELPDGTFVSVCPGGGCTLTATATTNGNPAGPDCNPDGTCGFNVPSGTPLTAVGTVPYIADNDDVQGGAWVAFARVNGGTLGTFAISHTIGVHTPAAA